jgi:DnaK suppressor protein
MTKSDVNSFRKVLEATVIELDNAMRRRDGIIIEGIGDEFDRMHTANERDLAIHTLEALSSRLRAALAALRRIEEGTYGICMECQDQISPRRLAALPAAALCIRCQETLDGRCISNSRVSFATAA